MTRTLSAAALVLTLCLGAARAEKKPGYVGSETCALCHAQIAERHSPSRMARTWQTFPGPLLRADYSRKKLEGPAPAVEYLIASHKRQWTYQVTLPGRKPISLPVEAALGGDRHGVSFLARLTDLEGSSPGRSALIATRYFHSARSGQLALNPGFPTEQPSSLETGLGWVLSPSFEVRCLTCHGSPAYAPTAERGVGCESCHGSGKSHLEAVAEQRSDKAILHPSKLSKEKLNQLCSQCHSGFSDLVSPRPQDLLISNQTTALELSECYIQSGRQLGCISCHDPHGNARRNDPRYVRSCLSCHAAAARRAATCPVNATTGCIGCHMPANNRPGMLPLVDHWIRVHPGEGSAPRRIRTSPSHVVPQRVFLRLLAVAERAMADALQKKLAGRASFFELARQHSIDPSAVLGGFLGETWFDALDPALAPAARRLRHGQVSEVIERAGQFVVLQRLPRDFRWQAEQRAEEAQRLADAGDADRAIERFQQAIRINPHFLQGLVALGSAFGEKGDGPSAVALLEQAVRFFPRASYAHFNLGIAYGLIGRKDMEILAYQRAIERDPDLLAAYVNLGIALASTGQLDRAAAALRQAIQINPLSAAAHYQLGRALEAQGQTEAARKEFEMTAKIDPQFLESLRREQR